MIGLHTSLGGVLAGQGRLAEAASRIAGSAVRGRSALDAHASPAQLNLSRRAVELIEAEHLVAVNARALGRIAEAESSVLDVLA